MASRPKGSRIDVRTQTAEARVRPHAGSRRRAGAGRASPRGRVARLAPRVAGAVRGESASCCSRSWRWRASRGWMPGDRAATRGGCAQRDPGRSRARDPRLARQPHGRGRRHLERARRAARRCRRAPRPATHEAVELRDGDERRYRGKGVRKAVAQRQRPIADGADRAWTPPTRRRSTRAARAGRHAEQGASSAPTRILGVSLAVATRGRAPSRAAAVPLPGRTEARTAAGADDEHPQRRRARGQQRRLPGVHDRAARAPTRFGEAPAHGRRGLPRAEGRAARRAASPPAVGDEGGFAPDLGLQRGGARGAHRGHRGGRLQARAATSSSRSTRPPPSSTSDGAYTLEHEGRLRAADELARLLADAVRPVPDRLDRGRPGRGRLGRLDGADRAARRPGPARRRRPVRHQPGAPAARHRGRRRQRDPGEGEPDRHADRDVRGDRDGARGRLHGRHSPPLRRDRGHTIADLAVATGCGQIKTGAPVAHRPGREVQPAAAHRGGSSATDAEYPGWSAIPRAAAGGA